jgi:hypothetical protein
VIWAELTWLVDSIKCWEVLEYHRDWRFLKKDSAPLNYYYYYYILYVSLFVDSFYVLVLTL